MKSTILAAHQYGQPEVLEFAQYALPPLAAGMARIHVKASGINPIDARRMTGEFKRNPSANFWYRIRRDHCRSRWLTK